MNIYTDEEKNKFIKEILDGIKRSPKGFLQSTIKKQEKSYLIDFINSCSPQCISNFSISTKINWILNNRIDFPQCKICGKSFNRKNVSALGNYPTYCSVKCEKNDKDNIIKCKETFERNYPTKNDKDKIKEKSRKTCLERYGSETYRNPEKNKSTKLEKYGNPNYNNTEKIKNTCLERYGVDNPFKSAHIISKIKNTKLEKYGDENYVNVEKTKKTCLEKFGTTSPLSNKECREKGKKTCLEKFGSYHFMKTEKGVSKMKNTKLKRYKDENFNNVEKAKKTCLEKYGVEHPSQLKEIRDKCRSKYLFNGQYFDSSWELAYYIWLSDNNYEFIYHPDIFFEYETVKDNKIVLHKYFPDFLVENKLIEIKGDDQLKNGTMIDKLNSNKNYIAKAKYECMLKHNIIIFNSKEIKQYLNYVSNKYGKNYLKSFKIKNNI